MEVNIYSLATFFPITKISWCSLGKQLWNIRTYVHNLTNQSNKESIGEDFHWCPLQYVRAVRLFHLNPYLASSLSPPIILTSLCPEDLETTTGFVSSYGIRLSANDDSTLFFPWTNYIYLSLICTSHLQSVIYEILYPPTDRKDDLYEYLSNIDKYPWFMLVHGKKTPPKRAPSASALAAPWGPALPTRPGPFPTPVRPQRGGTYF